MNLLTDVQATMHSLRLEGHGIFVAFFSRKAARGCAVHWKGACFSEAEWGELLSKACMHLGAQPGEIQIKLVGLERVAAQATRVIHRQGIQIAASSIRPSGQAELRYYPSSGRLQVAWQAISSSQVAPSKTRVLIVDDSATIRRILKTIFESSPDFEVVGCAERPSQVEALIRATKPNVLTLDIHMPEQDGVSLLRRLYPEYRIPAVMITSVSRDEGPLVLDALAHGAVDYIQKPTLSSLEEASKQILERVRIASMVKMQVSSAACAPVSGRIVDRDSIVAIGSSTGGTEALRELLVRLPAEIPPVVVVQHIPAVFSEALARRLDELCPFRVKEAKDGDAVLPGQVLIAPGGMHMKLEKAPLGGFKVGVASGIPVNRHMPSVDVLFESVAEQAGARAIGVILTGMGADGAKGLLTMRGAGARTIAQSEESCVVFGMPREAIKLGAAQEVRHLEAIPELLVDWLSQAPRSGTKSPERPGKRREAS